jgi:hypothetical protein
VLTPKLIRGAGALTLLLMSCDGPAEERAPAAAATAATAAAAVQDTLFTGTVEAIRRPKPGGPGAPVGTLRAARASQQADYDRIEFEFGGDSVPGYVVAYAVQPVRRCGSGDLVSLAGSHQLVVRFDPARAHDDQANVTVAQREAAPGLPAVKDLKLICDFEGQVEWALGVAGALPFRVEEASDPARLVVDVRHRP